MANAAGKVEIQIRDLDQTVIGNPAHDLIRMAHSLAAAAHGSDLPGITLVEMVEGYEHALVSPKPSTMPSDDDELGVNPILTLVANSVDEESAMVRKMILIVR